jgi:hypothetical protein
VTPSAHRGSPAGGGSSACGESARRPGSGDDGVGSIGVEAGRLFEALQQAAAGWSSARPKASTQGTSGGDGGTCTHDLPQTCRICPLCQVAHRLQLARPEVLQHVADAAASLAAAVGELAAARAAEPRAGERHDLQHIDITD